mgnify:CR=1 FL=1
MQKTSNNEESKQQQENSINKNELNTFFEIIAKSQKIKTLNLNNNFLSFVVKSIPDLAEIVVFNLVLLSMNINIFILIPL